jgi:hypothetical protein
MDDAIHVEIKIIELWHEHQIANYLIDLRIALRKLQSGKIKIWEIIVMLKFKLSLTHR